MKTLKFSPELVQLIISGQKTCTWRIFDDKDLKVGDLVTFVKRPELTPFAEAKLTSVTEKPLKNLTKEDKKGHESFESEEQMYRTYSNYYKQPVNGKTKIKIIHFKILKFN